MYSLVRRYIKTAIAFLALGLVLGVEMLVRRELSGAWPSPYLVTAHTHAILVGFMMFMILGVALWLFPRTKPDDTRYRPGRVEAAYWILLMGTVGRFLGESARPWVATPWLRWTIALTGVLQAAGLLVYFWAMWPRIRPVGSHIREAGGERFSVALLGILALPPQGKPDPPRLPVAVFAIVNHQVDSTLARSLTRWLIGSFHRDTSLLVIDRSGKARPARPQPVYAVATDLDRDKKGALRLTIRVVDVKSVYLVAMATTTGPLDSLLRALPSVADRLGDRIRVLYAIRQPDHPPPHWTVPINALQEYSLALFYLTRGDTAGAKARLREALRLAPKFADPCEALKRLEPAASCGR